MQSIRKILVTGGGGFLGGALCRALRQRGDEVRSISRGRYPALTELGVECMQGDLAEPAAVDRAVAGCDTVFHVAAKAGVWGPYADYHRSNVLATRRLIDACQAHGVSRLIMTSSPSVVYHGRDEAGIDESTPYPDHYLTWYPLTKAIAERAVLAANSPELATVALRPHLIWGPGDQHLLPRLVASARAGRLKQVGDGRNKVDTTYIDNAVQAHLAACERLKPGAACAGRAYFIANNEPWPLWELINRLLDAAGAPRVRGQVSARFAYVAGGLLEGAYWLMRKQEEPPMTRFVARQLATDHWYDLTAARNDLGYHPSVTVAEGLERLRRWVQEPSSPVP